MPGPGSHIAFITLDWSLFLHILGIAFHGWETPVMPPIVIKPNGNSENISRAAICSLIIPGHSHVGLLYVFHHISVDIP
jgi:hypothetical protein